ncbi:unnamed protein product, partial [marine sediment metagenome]
MKMSVETYYRILQHDPKGRLVKDTGLVPSHSYVIQFLELVNAFMDSIDKNATDVDGAESVLVMDAAGEIETKGRVSAAIGEDTYGIVVGTNATETALANENYKLDTKILHSATEEANKLNYQAVLFTAPAVADGYVDFD